MRLLWVCWYVGLDPWSRSHLGGVPVSDGNACWWNVTAAALEEPAGADGMGKDISSGIYQAGTHGISSVDGE